MHRSAFQRLRDELPGFIKKNRGLLVKPAFWSLVGRLIVTRVTAPLRQRPGDPVLFVATHHKVMTTYFNAVLWLLSRGLGLRYQKVNSEQPKPASRMVLSMHGKLDLPRLGRYRGVHVMRDPRDMIVSGYHYHKWTHEDWVHRPDETGTSYQQKLNHADKRAGLFMEIDHFIFYYRDTLERWNLDDPDILEVSYDSLMGPDRAAEYARIFAHLGLTGRHHALAVDLMRLFEAGSRTGRKAGAVAQKSHLRSGKSGQWQAELEPDHIAYIERELGPVLRKFGY
ncbi:sulfotransferase domain-containing protein [Rhodobacter sp. Har01]|uniref:sulfotransferase domain-containing protein n=1 Tax=Rhodobacter sp. Har01 TaxID=2883999 RepID=UPI001D05FB07|nr:sulfotransferase domain-containing protein [Rhodobacter sp. Har01]MCB6179836.1 sulfotransferase domain-containing protein [Rhodobacter sp. Har01]